MIILRVAETTAPGQLRRNYQYKVIYRRYQEKRFV